MLTKRYRNGTVEVVQQAGAGAGPCVVYALRESIDLTDVEDRAQLEQQFRDRVRALSRHRAENVPQPLDAEVTEDHTLVVVAARLPDDTPPLTLDRFLDDPQWQLTATGAERLVGQILTGLVELETALGGPHNRPMSEVFGDLEAADVLVIHPDDNAPRIILSRTAFGFLAHEGIHLQGNEGGDVTDDSSRLAPWTRVRKIIETIQEKTRGGKSTLVRQFLKRSETCSQSWNSWTDVLLTWNSTFSLTRKRNRLIVVVSCLLGGAFLGVIPVAVTGRQLIVLKRKIAGREEPIEKIDMKIADLQADNKKLRKENEKLRKRIGDGPPDPPCSKNDEARRRFKELLNLTTFNQVQPKIRAIGEESVRDCVQKWWSDFIGEQNYRLVFNGHRLSGTKTGKAVWYVYVYVDGKRVINGAPWRAKQMTTGAFPWNAGTNTELRLQITYKGGLLTGYWDTTIYDKTFTGPLALWKLHRALLSGTTYKTQARSLTIKGQVKGCPGPQPKKMWTGQGMPGLPAEEKR